MTSTNSKTNCNVTPSKTLRPSVAFSPKELRTPNKEQPGITRTLFQHTSQFYNLTQKWSSLKKKGLTLCRSIQVLKLHELIDDAVPENVNPLTETLLLVLEGMKHIVENMKFTEKQISALSRLHYSNEPVLSSWSFSKIAESVCELTQMFEDEYQMKKLIIENIAHCRDECLTEMYTSSWEFEYHIDTNKLAFFVAETGVHTSYIIVK